MAKVNVRITFRSEVYIEADSLKEARQKWESCELFSDEAKKLSADFIEIDSIEDGDTYDDLTSEWDKTY